MATPGAIPTERFVLLEAASRVEETTPHVVLTRVVLARGRRVTKRASVSMCLDQVSGVSLHAGSQATQGLAARVPERSDPWIRISL